MRAHVETVRWAIAGTGAARGRTERAAVILTLADDAGNVGQGEAAPLPEDPHDSLAQAERELVAYARSFSNADLSSPSAIFAVEAAHAALRGPAPVIGAVAIVVDSRDEAEAAVRAGATVLKVKVGEDAAARVRDIVGELPCRVRVDANRSWPAVRVAAELAALATIAQVDLVEEPCADLDYLDRPTVVPVALDETLAGITTSEIERLLDRPAVDVLVLKPTVVGGISRTRSLASRVRYAGGRAIVSHALEGPIGFEACARAAALVGGDEVPGLGPHPALRGWPRARIADAHLGTAGAIRRALDGKEPVALIHSKLAADEQARQRDVAERTPWPADTALVLFTSGSTGTARGVALSRAAIESAGQLGAAHLRLTPADRYAVPLSFAHAGGAAIVARCRASGTPFEILDGDLAALLARCTVASLVPTQLASLLDDESWRPAPTLRAILLGGAAAPRALLDRAAARRVPFLITYGMTEAFGQVATAPLERAGDPDAPLVPLPGVTIEAGTLDAPARVVVRAPMLATAYLDGRGTDAAGSAAEWQCGSIDVTPIAPAFATSDLGYLDAAGALHLVGRADDIIITGGENVHPLAVEAIALQTPGVLAACAFGIPDERWGQLVGIAITVDATFTLAAALAHWHHALPASARPREVAVTTAALPISATGKVDRRAAAGLPRHIARYG